ncbi:urease accessory protein UreD [Geomicrobium sediminis]|uniref:Urease accessory protein UreD n=1 Tax=Geomicrobium sediminis TaxID=1347788 RepID=A0ABS2PHI7_9BACL|nr:urease accessory protein UreD [Geomicrobium sediminis]MBM7634722.1 urease accessory protein [Geomicrobium sediminis]
MQRPKHDGVLEASFAYHRDKTKMIHAFQQPPLKVSRVLRLDEENPGHAYVYLMESSGGMVAGDRNTFRINAKAKANVTLIPQSATKIYPSHNEQPCVQELHIAVGEEASVTYLPEAVIPFEQSRFQTKTVVHLRSNSSLIWADLIAPGREHRGENFHYYELEQRMEVYLEGRLLALDAFRFQPEKEAVQRFGVLGEYRYVGSIWFFSEAISSIDVQELHDELMMLNNCKAGVTRLEDRGIHIRMLSNDQWHLKKQLEQFAQRFASLH